MDHPIATAKEYRAMSRLQRRHFREAGGKLDIPVKDRIGSVCAVLALCAIGWFVSKTHVSSDTPEKVASYACLATANEGITGFRAVYSSVQSRRDGPRYIVNFSFTGTNAFGKSIPGQFYCETDLTGKAVLLANVR